MSTSLISGGEVQPRISPGDRGLACGTVTLKLWLSSNSEATDCRVAANWMVLTKPNLGFGSVKNKKIDQKNLYIPSKFWVTCSFLWHAKKGNFLKFYKYWVSLCDIRGKSFSEALIFASTKPQYYDRSLFIELQVQYMKIPSSNLGRTCCVQKLFPTFRTIFVHNMFSPCSAKRRASDKDLPVHTVFLSGFNKNIISYMSC